MKVQPLISMKMNLIVFLLSLLLITSCKTGVLKEQIEMLNEMQTFLTQEKDSLQSVLDKKNRELVTKNSNIDELSSSNKLMEEQNKSLQSGLYTREEQLKQEVKAKEQFAESLGKEGEKSDSLQKEVELLKSRIASVDKQLASTQQQSSALAEDLKQEEAKRIADSIAAANKQAPVIIGENSGYINITEIGAGIGLGDVSVDYSRSFFSITNVSGYVINKHFISGLGIGVNAYNGGVLVPLYLDMRYTFNEKKFTPFIVADGGVVIDPKDFKASGLFINPLFGLHRKIPYKGNMHLSTGLLIQMHGTSRDAFINFKGGVSFMGK